MPISPRRICPYCKRPLLPGSETVACTTCRTAHHTECWLENDHCATVGCPGTPRREEPYTAAPTAQPLGATVLPAVYTNPFEMLIPPAIITIASVLLLYAAYGFIMLIADFGKLSADLPPIVRQTSISEFLTRLFAIVPQVVIGVNLLKMKPWTRVWAIRTLWFFYGWMLVNDLIYCSHNADFIGNAVARRWFDSIVDNIVTANSIQTVWATVFLVLSMVLKLVATTMMWLHLSSAHVLDAYVHVQRQRENVQKDEEASAETPGASEAPAPQEPRVIIYED